MIERINTVHVVLAYWEAMVYFFNVGHIDSMMSEYSFIAN
jgi:hypothetical protein